MKKHTFLFIPLLLCAVAGAQPIAPSEGFRVGKLDNGMTYYLYHNENPKGCADFYIAHNVGALQEEDNQNGLAHFLEHMAFNGLKHYPGKDMLNFLAKEGVRFGYNVNAFTSRKETVYNISSVPLVRESFVDSVMMILHDWSCDISCEQQALDDERGVINEEWRLRDEPRYRMMCRQNELVYKGGKHPRRTVLGSMDVILNFKREEILDFYHKWYRPDLQAIIITGDFDVDRMEEKVKAKFSDIRMPENAPQKPAGYMPPAQNGPLYEDMTDPTIKFHAVKVIYKQPYLSEDNGNSPSDEKFYKDYFARQIVSSVLASRLRESCREKGSPTQSAVFVTSASAPEFYISLLTLTPRGKENMAASLEIALREVKRLMDHGMSEREFEVARLNIYQTNHLERMLHPEDQKTDQLSKICYHNFLDGKPLLTPVDNSVLMRRLLGEVDYKFASSYIWKMFGESDKIYSNCVNEKEKDIAIPHDRMKEIVAGIEGEQTEEKFLEYPVLDMTVSAPAGRIAKRGTKGDVKVWTLDNGATVYFRSSEEFKSDEHFMMQMEFDGGFRTLDANNYISAKYATSYFKRYCGFRGTERQNFKNYPELMGINCIVDVHEKYNDLDIRVSGTQQVENAFKMAFLQLTEPYFPGEKHLAREKAASLKNLGKKKSDKELFDIDLRKAYYGENPWNCQMDSASVNAVSQTFVQEQYANCFGDFSTMKVYICSDMPVEQIEEYVCKYIASLGKGKPAKLSAAHPLVPVFKGTKRVDGVKPPVSEPFTNISYEFVWDCKRTQKNRVAVQIINYILSDRYLNVIREERGGTYHVGFSTDFEFDPAKPLSSYVDFQTRPELKDILLKDVEDVMDGMCQSGPSEKEMETACKYLRKYYTERKASIANSALSQNGELVLFVKYGTPYDCDYDSILSSIDAKYIKKLVNRIASDRRFISVYTEK